MLSCILPVWASDNPKIKKRFVYTSRYAFYDPTLSTKSAIKRLVFWNFKPVCAPIQDNLSCSSKGKQALNLRVCKRNKHRKSNFYSSRNWNNPYHDNLNLNSSLHRNEKNAKTRTALIGQV